MKKLLLTAAFAAAGFAFAEDAAKATKPETAEPAPQIEEKDDPLFWGFGNYGIYSGYQLYGSLVNSEPTLQGYLEGNVSLTHQLCHATAAGNDGYGIPGACGRG